MTKINTCAKLDRDIDKLGRDVVNSDVAIWSVSHRSRYHNNSIVSRRRLRYTTYPLVTMSI